MGIEQRASILALGGGARGKISQPFFVDAWGLFRAPAPPISAPSVAAAGSWGCFTTFPSGRLGGQMGRLAAPDRSLAPVPVFFSSDDSNKCPILQLSRDAPTQTAHRRQTPNSNVGFIAALLFLVTGRPAERPGSQQTRQLDLDPQLSQQNPQ